MREKEPIVLIVDDEEQVLNLLSAAMKKHGILSKTAKTGEEALSIIRKKDTIKLVLLDIFLPDYTGCELLKKILKLVPDMNVIMITGGADIETAKKCLEIGAKDYIKKPFDMEYLQTSIIAELISEL
ncbi:MAG TPA: response regulator [Victivallales bacterium]|nr:response regulator [Victivallales bacterium]HPO90522.1 response regulator [Victivallales bacterium]HRU00482.1 response regulator [Victivallales bacterium]